MSVKFSYQCRLLSHARVKATRLLYTSNVINQSYFVYIHCTSAKHPISDRHIDIVAGSIGKARRMSQRTLLLQNMKYWYIDHGLCCKQLQLQYSFHYSNFVSSAKIDLKYTSYMLSWTSKVLPVTYISSLLRALLTVNNKSPPVV